MAAETTSIDELTQFAIQTLRETGSEALGYYGQGRSKLKFDEDLITQAELHLNEFFRDRLAAHYPTHSIFAGGSVDRDYTHDDKRYMWIFDPLDGVSNFSAGLPIWGMSLALLENFWPVFGGFIMPSTGDLFYARPGNQAFHGKEALQISPQENISDESVLLTYSRFHLRFRSTFPGKILNLGCTGAHICFVAMGRAEAAFIVNESYRDLAAASIIIEAAGGEIYKLSGKKFSLNEYLDASQAISEPFLVVPKGLYPQVRAAILETQ